MFTPITKIIIPGAPAWHQ